MPRVIELADETRWSLGECAEAIDATGFDPRDEDSLLNAARALRRLGNDPDFLGDMLVGELAALHREDSGECPYGPQVMMLVPPGRHRDFFIRANLWPSQGEHMLRASGGASFVYGLPHDHNFDFLTLGYFGPGYWSDYYEFAYEEVAGWRGEPVPSLRFVERARLEHGKLMHYRAHLDVHAQIPADALSVSLNVMHADPAQGWFDQYGFDIEQGRIARIVSHGSSEAFLRIAVGLGCAEALDLAERFATRHPSDRMRLAAWDALASVAPDAAARDALWGRAQASGSRLVAAEAGMRRAAASVAGLPASPASAG